MNLIKIISLNDINLLSDTACEIWKECYPDIISKAQIDYMTEKFLSPSAVLEQIENQGYEYYFVCNEGKIIGFTAVKSENNRLFLSKLYFRKEERRNGGGKFVLDFLIDRCKADKLSYIYLTVNKNNTSAINAYKKWGFITEKEACTDIGNGFVMDDYIMKINV